MVPDLVVPEPVVPEPVVPKLVARWYLTWWYPVWWLDGTRLSGTQQLRQLVQTGGSRVGAWGCRAGYALRLWPALQAFGAGEGRVSPLYQAERRVPLRSLPVLPWGGGCCSRSLGLISLPGAQGLGFPFSPRQPGESRGAAGGWQRRGEAALADGRAASLLGDGGHQPRGLAHVARLSR